MQIAQPVGMFNQWGSSLSVPLPSEINSRIAAVDQLIQSNNGMDSVVTNMQHKLTTLYAQMSVLTRTINAISDVVIEIDGKEYSIGKLALQKVQLTEALTFSNNNAGQPA